MLYYDLLCINFTDTLFSKDKNCISLSLFPIFHIKNTNNTEYKGTNIFPINFL